MSLVRYIGDVHGDYRRYSPLITCPHPTVQIGDFGIGFVDPPPMEQKDRFIRGNHDSPSAARQHPNWIKDGTFEDGVLFIGGAFSVDWQWRRPGISWWADEQLSWEELLLLVDFAADKKPWLIISHDGPDSIIDDHILFPHKPRITTRTSAAFDAILARSPPKMWIFGHWHETRRFEVGGCKFQCLGIDDYVDVDLEARVFLENS